MSVFDRLKAAVGAQGFSEDASEIAPHLEEWRSKYKGHTPLLLKPSTTAQVSAVLGICHLDQSGMTLTVEAGVTLAQVQHAADDKGLLFPLSLASEGSCTIGGNIATNAGGTHGLRYGMA